MAFSGNTFSKLYDWLRDPQRNEKIFNSRLDSEFDGIATGLTSVANGVAAKVTGPASSTDNAVARFDGTGGNTIQNSGVTIDDSNNIAGVGNLTLAGNISGAVNLTQSGYSDLTEIAAPASPAANVARLFAKDNGSGTTKLYFKDSAGTQTEISLATPFHLINGKIVESRASSAATFAIKGLDGTDPSATNPVTVTFGDSTARTITAATSLTISSGSTLGASNATPFRLWLVGIDDAGTFRLGVQNCSDANGVYGFPGHGVLSSTAEGGAGAADSAGVTYTGTAAASKQFAILGFADYESGLAAAGTWNAAPTRIQLFEHGMARPGQTVQHKSDTNNTTFSTTSNAYQTTNCSVTITPTSPINKVWVKAGATMQVSASNEVA